MFHRRSNHVFLATSIFLHMIWTRGAAQPPSNADTECPNSMLSLMNCEPFLSGAATTPPDSCCAGLNDLVTGSSTCLCEVIAENPNLSDSNLTRALQLPVKCGIPIGACAAPGAPPAGPPSTSRPSAEPGILYPNDMAGSPIFNPSLLGLSGSALLSGAILFTFYF